MADENLETGTPPAGPPPEVLTEARALGWVPKEEFRGDPARWSDAESFVKRGHEVLPILRQNNKQLVATLQSVQEENARTRQALEVLQASTEEIVKDRVAAAKRELLTKIKEARDEGNVDLEVELTDQLADVRAREKSIGKPAAAPAAPAPPAVDPAFTAWKAQPENAWFGVDRRKTSLAMGIAQELRSDPANAGLTGVAFYTKVGQEVEAMLAPKTLPADKVNGSRPSGGGGSGSDGSGQSYADLPPEAKAACDKQAKRFAGTAGFKDEAAYRKHYAKLYFA